MEYLFGKPEDPIHLLFSTACSGLIKERFKRQREILRL